MHVGTVLYGTLDTHLLHLLAVHGLSDKFSKILIFYLIELSGFLV